MAYFTEEFLTFFKTLAPNNNKAWFDEHRKDYEQFIKQPFETFVDALIAEVRAKDPSIPEELTYKNCIFRINRDIRFSKDKTPYKLNRSAVVGPNGKKHNDSPSLYLEAGPEHFRLYTGLYQPDKDKINSIRNYLLKHHKSLTGIVSDEKFIANFETVHGERYKVLPKEFKALGEKTPLAFNKSWYIFKTYAPETILQENLMDLILSDYEAMHPFQEFFRKAVR